MAVRMGRLARFGIIHSASAVFLASLGRLHAVRYLEAALALGDARMLQVKREDFIALRACVPVIEGYQFFPVDPVSPA